MSLSEISSIGSGNRNAADGQARRASVLKGHSLGRAPGADCLSGER